MQILSSDTILLSLEFSLEGNGELCPEDDVDHLFKKLQRREPPVNIVKQILNRIRQLPPEQIYRPPQPEIEKPDVSEK